MINPFTREICLYVKGCERVGFGFIGSVGLKGGLAVGPKCGKDMGGWTVEPVAELAFGKGASANLAFSKSGLGAGKGGPGLGLGFSASVDFCYTKTYCFNSPAECKCK
jgi:hypothetical protein